MNPVTRQALHDELIRLLEESAPHEKTAGLIKLADNATKADAVFDAFAALAQSRGAKLAYAQQDPANLRHHLSDTSDVSVRRHATYSLGPSEELPLSDRLREAFSKTAGINPITHPSRGRPILLPRPTQPVAPAVQPYIDAMRKLSPSPVPPSR